MGKPWYIILLIALGIAFSGCAKKTMVVLIPDPDGTVGSITVTNQAGSVTMDQANQSTTIMNQEKEPSVPAKIDQSEIEGTFADAISIQPLPPVHFILYFKKGTSDLTQESVELIPNILAAIQERNSTDISVVGHTDTLGNKQYNLKLSKRRAAMVSDQLIQKGVEQDHLQVTSHGEENPLIETEVHRQGQRQGTVGQYFAAVHGKMTLGVDG